MVLIYVHAITRRRGRARKKNVEIDVFKHYSYNWLYCTSLTPRHEYVLVNIGGMLRMNIFKVN